MRLGLEAEVLLLDLLMCVSQMTIIDRHKSPPDAPPEDSLRFFTAMLFNPLFTNLLKRSSINPNTTIPIALPMLPHCLCSRPAWPTQIQHLCLAHAPLYEECSPKTTTGVPLPPSWEVQMELLTGSHAHGRSGRDGRGAAFPPPSPRPSSIAKQGCPGGWPPLTLKQRACRTPHQPTKPGRANAGAHTSMKSRR